MAYATQADVEAIYPDILKIVADHDDDGEADAAVVARGLAEADGIIDSHLSVQYALPLAQVPAFLRAIAVDIAVYRMALDQSVRTEEMRLRYEDHVKHLQRIADGKAGLGVSVLGEGETNPDAQIRSATVDYFVRR